MEKAKSKPKREMVSTKSFLRQLSLELEYELLDQVEVKRTRELRREVRRAVSREVEERLSLELAEDIEETLDRAREAVAPVIKEIRGAVEAKGEERWFQRFNISVRLQHLVMAVSVVLLILTGLPLKFPDNPLFAAMMDLFGGIGNSTLIHRIAACGLIAVSFWHLVYIIFFREGRRDFALMLPKVKDFKDFTHMILYFFGRKPAKPKFGRFSYVEKFDYWAVYWGCVIMIGTGVLLWSPDFTFTYFPKYFYDIAKEVHSDEALLATLAIVIWHFYNVHFNPSVFPGSLLWWHGRLPEHKMAEEHPLEYEEILAREAGGGGMQQEEER